MYRTDAIVRNAKPLQESAANDRMGIYVNQATADQYQLVHGYPAQVKQADGTAELPVFIDTRIPDHCLYIPAGFAETINLGGSFADIEITKNQKTEKAQ